jgi:hypothetical protein
MVGMILRLIEARCNEIRSQPPLFAVDAEKVRAAVALSTS